MIISARIDVTKIDKNRLYVGKKGKYLDVVLMDNRDGPDQFGNDFMVCESVTKEERAQGVKGTILGNGKYLQGAPSQPAPSKAPARAKPAPNRKAPVADDGPPDDEEDPDSDVPF